jgi:ATP-dependent DNA helicase RecG
MAIFGTGSGVGTTYATILLTFPDVPWFKWNITGAINLMTLTSNWSEDGDVAVSFAVEESEKMDLRDATKRYEYLRDKVFPNFSVGLLHGRMKPELKDEVMQRFVRGEIQILVSTTVIEVGVDVPNASVMVIEHAERFGLSQLHQLRGRVGRGAEQSYCVLLASDKQTDVARERLGIMEETNDGFKIAEKDLEIRGPGELMGTRQAGLPEFRVANLVRDLDILQAARREADYYFNQMNESGEAASLLERVRSDARLKLAAVG